MFKEAQPVAASHLFFGVDLRLGGIIHLAVDSRSATSNRELVRDVVEPLPIVNAANGEPPPRLTRRTAAQPRLRQGPLEACRCAKRGVEICPVGGALAATLAGSMLDRASRAINIARRANVVKPRLYTRTSICLLYALFSISTTAAHAATLARLRQCGAAILAAWCWKPPR